jgi:peroxiredoxin
LDFHFFFIYYEEIFMPTLLVLNKDDFTTDDLTHIKLEINRPNDAKTEVTTLGQFVKQHGNVCLSVQPGPSHVARIKQMDEEKNTDGITTMARWKAISGAAGCGGQAISINNLVKESKSDVVIAFKEAKGEVFGVSGKSSADLQKFINEKNLSYPLISIPNKTDQEKLKAIGFKFFDFDGMGYFHRAAIFIENGKVVVAFDESSVKPEKCATYSTEMEEYLQNKEKYKAAWQQAYRQVQQDAAGAKPVVIVPPLNLSKVTPSSGSSATSTTATGTVVSTSAAPAPAPTTTAQPFVPH